VAQTAADVAQALPSWPSVEEQRRMLQPLPGWQGTAVDAAKQWAEGVMMGTTAPGDVPPPGIVAYHGSPHSFDQFDTSKIGTGEGAQAYGHGLYFAGNEGVARSYRDALSQNLNQTESAAYRDASSRKAAADAAMTELHWKMVEDSKALGAKPDNPGWGDYGVKPLPEVLTKYQDQWDALAKQSSGAHNEMQEIVTGPRPKGSMYQVNIGADPEHFLDWDKPLSEQSQHVQDALKPLGYQSLKDAFSIRAVENGHVIDYVDNSGQARTTSRVFPTQDAAEQAARVSFDTFGRNPTGAEIVLHNPGIETQLHEAGIPGIRYLDAGSRNAGEGSRNTVVFDPAMIDILRKYGLAGLIAGGGAAAAATQQQQLSQ
jgi:hypothetical protein